MFLLLLFCGLSTFYWGTENAGVENAGVEKIGTVMQGADFPPILVSKYADVLS